MANNGTRSQAEELLAAERAENARLRDSTLPMACDPDEWTAAEEVLAHLLINVIGAPDDVPYTPNQAQEVIERQLKRIRELDDIEEMLMDGQGDDDGAQIMPEFEAGWSTTAKVEECLHLLEKRRDVIEGFEADNAALTARIKELEQINADLCRSHGVLNVTGAKLEGQVEALEAKLAAAEKALSFYADPSKWNDGYFKSEDDGTVLRAYPPSIENDQGDKARAALGGKPS
ncbi:hypothetical protein I6H96_11540 [Brucella anthropi]|uniref:Uncharacterized protein n=1 Tax=Brucella anthropi (strain ATCC 49188 / DSM 6882 / CCUG 24695 / JCM 21032 / LMG 3331 / NBRC 15819 / NCTC 12168 / Alc 37) TaxID=439375 RepID=A6WVD4_BRUA4|nr:hypothetical protein [Brucella anthropi]ABS12938.1 hypothetical protein Oant_0207 [Brucella anthropi ATCC 49188]QQC24811.1 hypothetical protein I6H96_11540 [Brucella anthropi]SUA60171.1 Uncharacterised protein [Brucella anthropi]